jgi:histidine triad (HIT) family protein
MDECQFCQLVAGKSPAEVIFETESSLAFFPTEPATRGHTMVIPKRHVESFLDVCPADARDLTSTSLTVGKALRAVLAPEGMNLIASSGIAASQSIMHVHIHLVPRWTRDAVGEIWPPKTPTAEAVLEDVADALRDFFNTHELENRNRE